MNDKKMGTGWLKPTKDDTYQFDEVELSGERIFRFHIMDESGNIDHTLAIREPILESIFRLDINSPETWIAAMNLYAETSVITRLFELHNLADNIDEWLKNQSKITMKDIENIVNTIKGEGSKNDKN